VENVELILTNNSCCRCKTLFWCT